MPIHCPFEFPRLSEEEMRTVDFMVMRHAFDTHNELGRLCDESVYQLELVRRLRLTGIEVSMEVPITLSFREFSIGRSLDLVIAKKIIYELKAVAELMKSHEGQLLEYLYLTNSTRGKLVNFRTKSVESRFVNTTFQRIERQTFQFDEHDYSGDGFLPTLVQELVADWGTGLSTSLYRRAILGCTLERNESEQQLPMVSGGQSIGNQRFHLLSPDTALGVTTYSKLIPENRQEFEKLITASPLSRLQWVNIYHHQVTVTTIENDRKILRQEDEGKRSL